MEKLQAELDRLIDTLPNARTLRTRLESLVSVYPFNEYEYVIATLLAASKLTFDEYLQLRDGYIERNTFLYLYEMSAPRGFGESWAHGHLKELVPELQRPSKKLDANYSGEYDFFLGGIRIEVKASRAVDAERDAPIYEKALASDSNSHFDMNFQQLKPSCCDVFIWIGVWRDLIRYWVLTADEVERSPYYSPGQHRGNAGEGQLHLKDSNLHAFTPYQAKSTHLGMAIRDGAARQHQARKR